MLSNVFVQYENFQSDKTGALDITAHLGGFVPANMDCYDVDDTYSVKPDYLYCSGDSHKRARWAFELSGFESAETTIRISNNVFGGMWIQGVLLDFLIQYQMNLKGVPMIHASGVSKDNRAYVFSARSGGGKTTIALNLLEHGFKLLGDNFVILNNGNVMSYLSPLNLFRYNLVPIVKKRIGRKNQLLMGLKDFLYRITGGYAKLFTKINIKDAFPENLIDTSPLDTIFILIPKERFQVESISREVLLGHLIANQKLDFLDFIEYASEYSFLFPESELATHWKRYENNLRRNLGEDIAFIKVEVPRTYDRTTIERLLGTIDNRIKQTARL